MKRLILATVALSMLAAPAAMAGERYGQRHGNPGWHEMSPKHSGWDKPEWKKGPQWKQGKKAHWKKGQRFNDWKRGHSIQDYKRHGLRKPGHGQRWVRVDNDYILIAVSSGIIAALIAGR